jgi:predicted nucleic acid-binding protein
MAAPFIDTSVLLYRFADAPGPDAPKRAIARELVDGEVSLSAQVLQEFYWQATHPDRRVSLAPADAAAVVRQLASGPVQEVTAEVVIAAVATSQRLQISYRDAAIIEAAKSLGCETVLSEGLRDGQDYGGVRVINPFAGADPQAGY